MAGWVRDETVLDDGEPWPADADDGDPGHVVGGCGSRDHEWE